MTYCEGYIWVQHLLENRQRIELRHGVPAFQIQCESWLVQPACWDIEECQYERKTDHRNLPPEQVTPAGVLNHDASYQRAYPDVSEIQCTELCKTLRT